MADVGPNLSAGLELCMGATTARKVARGPIFWGLLFGSEGVQVLARVEAGPVSRPAKKTAGHNYLLHWTKDCPNKNLCGRFRADDSQCARPLADTYSGTSRSSNIV